MAEKKYESDMTFKEKRKEEISKLKAMPMKKRLSYFWEYYKPLMAGVIAVIVIIASIVSIVKNSAIEDVLTVAVINPNASDEETYTFVKGFKEYIELDEETQRVTLDTSLTLSYDESAVNEYTSSSLMKFVAVVAAQELDIMIMSETVYENNLSQSTFMDLEEFLSEELYSKVEPYLIMGTIEADTTSRAYAIDISNREKVTEGGGFFNNDKILLGVVSNTKRQEAVIQFIEYLFSE